MNRSSVINSVTKMVSLHHRRQILPNQCSSTLGQAIDAPLPLVWSMVRQFDNPQAYKPFVRSCAMQAGEGGAGSVREVTVISGLPGRISIERLDRLDEDLHVMIFSIIGGDHRLENYQAATTLHEGENGRGTVVIESYVVDVPAGNSKEETCVFADTIVACNLKSLASISEKVASRTQG